MTDVVENQAEEQAESPTITLVDLQNTLRIIDTAAERGAFRGNELTAVGGVRDKIAAFLEAVLPKEEVAEPAAEQVKETPAPKAPAKKRAPKK